MIHDSRSRAFTPFINHDQLHGPTVSIFVSPTDSPLGHSQSTGIQFTIHVDGRSRHSRVNSPSRASGLFTIHRYSYAIHFHARSRNSRSDLRLRASSDSRLPGFHAHSESSRVRRSRLSRSRYNRCSAFAPFRVSVPGRLRHSQFS